MGAAKRGRRANKLMCMAGLNERRPTSSTAAGHHRLALREGRPRTSFEEVQRGMQVRSGRKHPTWGWRKDRWHRVGQPAWDGVALNRKRARRLWRDGELFCKPKTRKSAGQGPTSGPDAMRRRVPNARAQL